MLSLCKEAIPSLGLTVEHIPELWALTQDKTNSSLTSCFDDLLKHKRNRKDQSFVEIPEETHDKHCIGLEFRVLLNSNASSDKPSFSHTSSGESRILAQLDRDFNGVYPVKKYPREWCL